MSQQSNIEWTDATWNPVRGCVKVSPGCANCYAETFAERFRGVNGHPYEQGFDLRLVPEKLLEPLSWKKPRRVFVNSMSDLFQDGVPWAFIEQAFDVMQQTPQHTYQVLTKRAENMRLFAEWWAFHHDGPLANVWLGVSVENQRFADERIPLLLHTPAAVRFISAEPLLGAVRLDKFLWDYSPTRAAGYEYLAAKENERLHWVIVGGESGHGARQFHVEWARSIVEQCFAARVPVFVKQLGADARDESKHSTMGRLFLRSRKGGDPDEWPADLRVREFPKAF